MGRPFSHFKSLVFRSRQRTCTPFRISASVNWLPMNSVAPVTRAFNEFFFLTCKIFHSPPLLPLEGRVRGGVTSLVLFIFLGLSMGGQAISNPARNAARMSGYLSRPSGKWAAKTVRPRSLVLTAAHCAPACESLVSKNDNFYSHPGWMHIVFSKTINMSMPSPPKLASHFLFPWAVYTTPK
jgi:hypothetical protein